MAKVPVNTFRLLRRRAYCSSTAGGGAERCVRGQIEAAAAKEAGDHWNSTKEGPMSSSVHQKDHHEVFWMRDPKTGNWVPESHFHDQVDVAELREKFLPKKTRSTL